MLDSLFVAIENELFPADLEGWIEEWILDEFQDL